MYLNDACKLHPTVLKCNGSNTRNTVGYLHDWL